MPQWTDKLGTNRCSFFDYSRLEHGEVVMHAVIQLVQRMKHAAAPQHRCLMSNDRTFYCPSISPSLSAHNQATLSHQISELGPRNSACQPF